MIADQLLYCMFSLSNRLFKNEKKNLCVKLICVATGLNAKMQINGDINDSLSVSPHSSSVSADWLESNKNYFSI